MTSAVVGASTMEHLDDLLAGTDTPLSKNVLDPIDAIVPPGTDVGHLDQAFTPPALLDTQLRRRPMALRGA